MPKNQFENKEAEAILMEAARRQAQSVGGESVISRDRLEVMAAELDIAPETLEQVLADREAAATEAELRKSFIRERRSKVSPAIIQFLSINLMMLVIWAISTHGHGHPWFLYVLLGTGIGLIRRIASALPTSGAEFDEEFGKYKKEHERRAVNRERRAARREEKNAAKRAAELAERELDADPGDILTTRPTTTDADNEILRVGRGR